MFPKEKHIHKLRRHKYATGNMIYFCQLPDCNYKCQPALAIGKRMLCNRCNESFIMNEYAIRLARPHCEKCHKIKNPKNKLKNLIHLNCDKFNYTEERLKELEEPEIFQMEEDEL